MAVAALILALTLGVLAACKPTAAQRTASNTVLGVGATFPAPLYTRWANAYRATSGVAVTYQGVGSGSGVNQLLAKTVDFAASDRPMAADQLAQAGLYQFPTVIGGVTPVVNVPGIASGKLKLSGPLLAEIYLGQVTRWNDPQIVALNPGLKLPDTPITAVHRTYPSGTTFLFTSYLSRVSPAWAARVGANDAVAWPTGVADRGNGGVAAAVKQTVGAIGYVEYAYAREGQLALVQMQDHDGAFVVPSADSFALAAAGANWARSPGNYVLLLDQPGVGSWPITGATFVMIYRQPPKPPKTRQVLAFFDWAFRTGDSAAVSLDYVPLPLTVKDLMRKQWATTVKDASGQPIFKPAH